MDIGWLNTKYSFSFANWHNPNRMGFGKLRVFNDDVIKSGGKFEMHPHSDMEIITIVMEGAVTHEDSMGNKSKIDTGKIQVMSAGTGVVHSEANEEGEDLHLYQIWIEPEKMGIEPRYEESEIDWAGKDGLTMLVSRDGRNKTIKINQEAEIYLLNSNEKHSSEFLLKSSRGLFIFVIEGNLNIDDQTVGEGDSVEIDGPKELLLSFDEKGKALLIDTPV